LSEAAIARAGKAVQAVKHGHSGTMSGGPIGTNRHLYTDANPLDPVPFDDKVRVLAEIDAFARALDPHAAIAARQGAGGAAEAPMTAMIDSSRGQLAASAAWFDGATERAEGARQRLLAMARQVAGEA
jgi:hypothetical protein